MPQTVEQTALHVDRRLPGVCGSERVDQRIATLEAREVLHEDRVVARFAIHLSRCGVRTHDHPQVTPQAAFDRQRFDRKHIEPGATQMPGIQGRQQRAFVEQAAAGDVDDEGAARQRRQGSGTTSTDTPAPMRVALSGTPACVRGVRAADRRPPHAH